MVDTIGYVAGTLTTLAFVPQVIGTWRRRSSDGMSTSTLFAFTAGVGLWVVYGIIERAVPIIVFNSVTFALGVSLIVMKRQFTPK